MVLGIVLFALGIMVSIVLHEYGHMRVAQWSGMKVRRFFVGFGPTLWSVRRGGIEYGLKAVPLGGFCDIAGMTAYDELAPEDEPRAMWRQAWWKRVAVLLAGPAMNIVLAIALFYTVAVGWGLVNRDVQPIPTDRVAAVVGDTCAGADRCGVGVGPAGEAGILAGDRITSVDGLPVGSWSDLSEVVSARPGQTVPVTLDRAGETVTTTASLTSSSVAGQERGALGVRLSEDGIPPEILADPAYQTVNTYDALGAVPATFVFTGEMIEATIDGLISFPSKIPAVAASIFGAERADDSPVSVVGASHIGGQAAEQGAWWLFLLFLAGLNLFLGAFNLVPLTPFDGGHIAVVFYEKIRDALRRLRGLAPGGPADYEKLAPITIGVFVLLMGVSAIVITADFVNPILLTG
ncbi:MAG: site-2 protease family protein [Dietzia sp.]|uniref:M50 family metallopeptidase n=1 Tax=Dietzia TaxID=37914 RepID=UPI0015FAC0EE|nr:MULTISPECIES: site-2 protease family protein [unclassified Dietzia]MBB1041325.1 site-2 protease family protein [Dietzia sp. Cai40]MBB1044893.1 site-2 protease family protein [Dietzia sp. DQ11-44]MBB1050944.1 site-2 protease family protein [Dietzia sp. CW19]MBB1054452.1 site-2 protease family protein [Dietzia sp. B44]MBB1056576.1 site-2 protease family protein [Dietzia sp. B19]